MNNLVELKFAEYICANGEFPRLYGGIFLSEEKFRHPEYPNRSCYLMKTDFFEPKNPVFGDVKKDIEKLNELLVKAKNSGYKYIVLHTRGNWSESKPLIAKLVEKYDCPPNWYPGECDSWHDGSGSYYTDGYIKSTPIFKWILNEVKDCRPPIRWRSVFNAIKDWVYLRASEKKELEKREQEKEAVKKAEQQCICGPKPCLEKNNGYAD